MGGNTLTSGLRGPITCEFNDGTAIRFNCPDFKLGGTIMGDRTIETMGTVLFEDLKHQLKAILFIDTYKETGWMTKTRSGSKTGFEGLIYKCSGKKGSKITEYTQFGIKQKLPESEKHIKDFG